eukprot:scaffold199027_cov18-Tisochrysis_lutea.AAC.1
MDQTYAVGAAALDWIGGAAGSTTEIGSANWIMAAKRAAALEPQELVWLPPCRNTPAGMLASATQVKLLPLAAACWALQLVGFCGAASQLEQSGCAITGAGQAARHSKPKQQMRREAGQQQHIQGTAGSRT